MLFRKNLSIVIKLFIVVKLRADFIGGTFPLFTAFINLQRFVFLLLAGSSDGALSFHNTFCIFKENPRSEDDSYLPSTGADERSFRGQKYILLCA